VKQIVDGGVLKSVHEIGLCEGRKWGNPPESSSVDRFPCRSMSDGASSDTVDRN
jgi:hypothetical protein